MPEFLVPVAKTDHKHFHDPYTQAGARSVLRRFRDDMMLMFQHMLEQEELFKDEGGKTFLAKSPLRRKVYVAAAMKTLGLIREGSSSNGACTLKLTERGYEQIENAKAMGWME